MLDLCNTTCMYMPRNSTYKWKMKKLLCYQLGSNIFNLLHINIH